MLEVLPGKGAFIMYVVIYSTPPCTAIPVVSGALEVILVQWQVDLFASWIVGSQGNPL